MDAKQIAINIFSQYQTSNPFSIADARNIQIISYPLPDTTYGYYLKYRRVQNIILRDSLPDALRPFVCAHELGHAICHPDINTQWLLKNTFTSISRYEREASTFAVELLLPDTRIREHSGVTLYELAKIYGIPPSLINLKKFSQ